MWSTSGTRTGSIQSTNPSSEYSGAVSYVSHSISSDMLGTGVGGWGWGCGVGGVGREGGEGEEEEMMERDDDDVDDVDRKVKNRLIGDWL